MLNLNVFVTNTLEPEYDVLSATSSKYTGV
jgi:hypothetical protein